MKLGDMCTITSSKRIFAADYVDVGIPFYRSKEIIEKNRGEEVSSPLYISEERFDVVKSKFGAPSKDDILLTSVGTIGIPYQVKSSDKFYFKDGNLTWLKDFSTFISPQFLYYCISNSFFKTYLNSICIGSSQSALTIEKLKNIEISVPSLNIQNKVTEILSQYDEALEVNRRRIAILEEMAMRTYREWFVFFRFPGHETTEFVEGLPKGWIKKSASSFFDISIGKTPARKEPHWFVDKGTAIPWLSISDMKNRIFVSSSSEDLTEDAINKHHIVVVEPNTVLLSFKLTVGRVVITDKPMCTNEAIAHFKTHDTLRREYTYCYLKNFQFSTLGSTSSIATAINSKTVKAMPFIMPNESILESFHIRTNPLFEAIQNIINQIYALQQIRDRLLPQLMSGKIEVIP